MNDQGLLYIFIEPDTTTNAYYKDDGIIDVHIFANSMGYDVEYHRQLNSFEDMATRINGYKISCDLLREIEIALLIYEPHDFRKRVIELIKLAEVW